MKQGWVWTVFKWWHDLGHHNKWFFNKIDGRKVAYHREAPIPFNCSCGKELGRYHFTDDGWWEEYCEREKRKSHIRFKQLWEGVSAR